MDSDLVGFGLVNRQINFSLPNFCYVAIVVLINNLVNQDIRTFLYSLNCIGLYIYNHDL